MPRTAKQHVEPHLGLDCRTWENLVHNHEVRWPYVFVSGYLDGLQIFNLMDPENPVTVGYFDTYVWARRTIPTSAIPCSTGTFGVDVRNEDGLIVVSDMTTGILDVQDGGLPRMERHRVGDAGHFQRPEVGRGPRSRPVSQ